MSDDLATAPSDNPGVDLRQTAAASAGQLDQFARDVAVEINAKIPDPKSDQRRDLYGALNAAMTELMPQGGAAHSSQARGASQNHRDEFKIRSNFVGAAVGVAATLTQNPVLEIVSKMLSGDPKGQALAKLEKLLDKADITKIKGVKLSAAVSNAQAQANTIKAVDSLGANGITGHLYPPEGQSVSNDLGPAGKAAFIMKCAVVANIPAEREKVQALTIPPVKASKAQIEESNQAGKTTGLTVAPAKSAEFTAVAVQGTRDAAAEALKIAATPAQSSIPHNDAAQKSAALAFVIRRAGVATRGINLSEIIQQAAAEPNTSFTTQPDITAQRRSALNSTHLAALGLAPTVAFNPSPAPALTF